MRGFDASPSFEKGYCVACAPRCFKVLGSEDHGYFFGDKHRMSLILLDKISLVRKSASRQTPGNP